MDENRMAQGDEPPLMCALRVVDALGHTHNDA